MKNYIMVIGSLFTSCAFANPFAGAYITGGLGGISTDFQTKGNTTLSTAADPNIFNISNNSNIYANNILGTLGLGYAYALGQDGTYIIGVQGDVNFFNTSRTQTANFSEIGGFASQGSSIKSQLRNSYDILFRPGWLMDASTLLYGLIGASFGNFQVSQSANFHENAGTIVINNYTSSSRSSWRTGFTVGLGVQQYIWKNISAALEYSHTDYGNLSLANSSSAPILIDGVAAADLNGQVSQARASTNSVLLRLIYNFS